MIAENLLEPLPLWPDATEIPTQARRWSGIITFLLFGGACAIVPAARAGGIARPRAGAAPIAIAYRTFFILFSSEERVDGISASYNYAPRIGHAHASAVKAAATDSTTAQLNTRWKK
jgi:hypothetical protein